MVSLYNNNLNGILADEMGLVSTAAGQCATGWQMVGTPPTGLPPLYDKHWP